MTDGLTLRLIGYWSGPDDDQWPDPRAFVDPGGAPSWRPGADSDWWRGLR